LRKKQAIAPPLTPQLLKETPLIAREGTVADKSLTPGGVGCKTFTEHKQYDFDNPQQKD
jgi:hypothetical protein